MESLTNINAFTDILNDENYEIIENSQPMSLISSPESQDVQRIRPEKHTGQHGEFRSVEEIDTKYRNVFSFPYFNLVQSRVMEDVLYSDKSVVVCAPTGSGKTVVFEMAIVKLLMDLEKQGYNKDFKIIYMAPVKAICTERLTEWHTKFTPLGCLCIEVTGDTDVEFSQLKPYRIIITTPEKWHMLTRRWTDHRNLVEVIKLFLIDEVHILNDETRGPVLEAVVSRMKTIEASCITTHRNETLQRKVQNNECINDNDMTPRIRFVAVSATVSNPDDVAKWLSNNQKPAIFHKFGDECRPVKINRVVEGYPCPSGTSLFKFDIMLNYKLWNIIQRYYNGKPTLIFCNTRKSVTLTAETLAREITITFNNEQQEKLTALASNIKNKKLQALILSGVGCHHAGMLYDERFNIERAFRNRDLPILITTTTLAMGVNLPAHLVIIKNTQQYVNGAYQEYSISTILQMVGRAGRPQFDVEATAVIMTRNQERPRYQSLVGGSEPLQSYLHRRLAENLNSEVALRTVTDIAQCVEWLTSTFLYVRAGRDPRRYLSLPSNAAPQLISKKIEDLCVKSMNGLASSGLITMDDACCIESTEAGNLMSHYYLDFETMKHIMKIDGTESLERLLLVICECHELAEMHLRVDERRCLNALNRNNTGAAIRFPMKGKITTRQMKLNCMIQSILGSLHIPDPSLNQEATKIIRVADRVCKCMVAYITRTDIVSKQSSYFSAALNAIILAKCISAQLWENSPYVSRQLRGIGPAFSNLLVTAGKTSFLLLEESHPRDLERIMNKGPPAGNILRKQISLLPKYQLDLTPVNHKTVSIKVVLVNHTLLSENLDSLTAGDNHRSYIIVGDTENRIILFTSFRDIDLINVYDGCIDYLVDRKNDYEYKIIVYCLSSSFVGLDVKSEYIFKGIAPENNTSQINFTQTNVKSSINNKQTLITNTFKERKRKNDKDINVECKEKRKRNCALINELNSLKESLNKQSEEKNTPSIPFHKDNDMKKENTQYVENSDVNIDLNIQEALTQIYTDNQFDDMDFPDTTKVLSILNQVENEISGMQKKDSKNTSAKNIEGIEIENFVQNKYKEYYIPMRDNSTNNDKYLKFSSTRQTKNKPDNFKFLEKVEKRTNYKDEEGQDKHKDGFSESIKSKLNNFLENTKKIKTNNDIDTRAYKINEVLSNYDGDVHSPQKSDLIINEINANKLIEKSSITDKNEVETDFEMELNNIDFSLSDWNETYINSNNITANIENTLKDNYDTKNTDNNSFNRDMSIFHETSKIVPAKAPHNFIIPNDKNNFKVTEVNKIQGNETNNFESGNLCKPVHKLPERNITKGLEQNRSQNMYSCKMKQVPPHLKINSIDSVTSTIITPLGTKQFDDKTVNNYKLELLKKVTLDVDVVDYKKNNVNDSKYNGYDPRSLSIPAITSNENETKYDPNFDSTKNMSRYFNTFNNCSEFPSVSVTRAVNVIPNDESRMTAVSLYGSIPDILTKADSLSKYVSPLERTEEESPRFNTLKPIEAPPVVANRKVNIIPNDKAQMSIVELNVITDITNKENSLSKYVSRLERTAGEPRVKSFNTLKSIELPLTTEVNVISNDKSQMPSVSVQKNEYSNNDKTGLLPENPNNFTHKIVLCDKSKQCPVQETFVNHNNIADNNILHAIENTSVESILSKYSKVLRKNNNIDVIKQNPATTSNTTIRNHTTNKLFKIKNINNIDVNLPSNFLPDTQTFSPIVDVELLIENKQEENEQRILKEILNASDFVQDIDLGQKEDIQQSMFNPKTFLEHYHDNDNEEDIVISPPAKFSDTVDFTNENDKDSVTMNQLEIDNGFNVEEHELSTLFNEKSIFEDSCGPSVASVNMSVSHEIETWTLSPEEGINNISPVNNNMLKSFTLMRNNNPICSSSSIGARKEKLGSFKFCKKDKFKYKNMF